MCAACEGFLIHLLWKFAMNFPIFPPIDNNFASRASCELPAFVLVRLIISAFVSVKRFQFKAQQVFVIVTSQIEYPASHAVLSRN